MVECMLGNYLVKTGRISSSQLESILDKMDSVRVKLGLIAVSEGFMTFAQAEEVNTLQASMDKRFGDIAVEKGYLTDEQVGKLLKQQGNTYLTFAQTLVDEGIAKIDELDGILESYRVDGGFTNSELDAIKSDDVDTIVPIFLPEGIGKIGNLVGVAVRTVIRLIDRHASIGKVEESEKASFDNACSQELQGNGFSEYGFMAEVDGGLQTVASFFGQMDFEEMDEDALDATAELLNCINGLYASERSKEGQFLELMPPKYSTEALEVPGKKKYLIPMSVCGQTFYFGVTTTM